MAASGTPQTRVRSGAPLSARASMTAALAGLTLVGAAVVIALVLLTTLLHKTTLSLDNAVEGLRTAEAIEGDLLRHSRLSDPALQASVEGDARLLLEQAHRYEANGGERQIIDDLARASERYFSSYHAARSAGLTPDQASGRTATELGAAFAAAKRYADTQVSQAKEAQRQSAAWDQLANWIGIVAGAVMLLMSALGMVWIRRVAFAPVRRISDAMQRFRRGDEESRAPVQGPSELRMIATGFNEMASELAEQQQRQLAFLGGVVHDLRNPLSALQLSTARLDPDRGALTDEQARSTLAIVRRQIALLNRMTGDLLDAVRIRKGQLEFTKEDRDVRELASAAVELFQSASADHRLTLAVADEPAIVCCDPLRIEQILNNLISNAIKYSPAGGSVKVGVRIEEDDVELAVSDEGVGIAPDDLPHIFEPFRRTGASRESVRGVGLGLYVTKRIVEAHGGRIEVDSTPGEGSTFRVFLPLSGTASRERVAQPHPEPPSASP